MKAVKREQVLIIEPHGELRFKGRLTEPATSHLRLTNPSEKTVHFKIQTTAPKSYLVRPNSGVLEAGGTAVVEITVQPFFHVPAGKIKHKFMVQSFYAPEMWGDEKQLMDSKLECVFEVIGNRKKRPCNIL